MITVDELLHSMWSKGKLIGDGPYLFQRIGAEPEKVATSLVQEAESQGLICRGKRPVCRSKDTPKERATYIKMGVHKEPPIEWTIGERGFALIGVPDPKDSARLVVSEDRAQYKQMELDLWAKWPSLLDSVYESYRGGAT